MHFCGALHLRYCSVITTRFCYYTVSVHDMGEHNMEKSASVF